MNGKYIPLEPGFSQQISQSAGLTSGITDLATSATFLYGASIMIIVVVAGLMYAHAGALRMGASTNSINKSNAEIRRVTIGLLGVLSLFLIISAVNKDLLTGNVNLNEFGTGSVVNTVNVGGGGVTNNNVQTSSNSSSKSCESTNKTIYAVQSGTLCASESCKVLSDCKYKDYISIIKSESQNQGVDPKMVVAIMCRESRGILSSQNINRDSSNNILSYDCGLMQINQKTPCDSDSFSPISNISKGVSLIKKLTASEKRVYAGIPSTSGVFASYNCCANGTIPNAPSADCTPASGFPYTIPKWACPINPGEGTFNMCAVKNYTCELNNCLKDPSLQNL